MNIRKFDASQLDKRMKESRASFTGHSPYAYLRNGLAIPERHGQGIGCAVYQAFYNWVRSECNASHLYLDYTTTNPASRSFWLAQGFRPIAYGLQKIIFLEKE